jgi:uncharacterized membrane protein YfcA
MDLFSLILPDQIAPLTALILLMTSFAGSFITISFGIGGGGLLLAVMASFLPPAALVPVHGVVQFGSNAGRTAMMFRHIQWWALWWFAAGIVAGIVVGASIAVAIPPAVIQIGVGLFLIWTVFARAPVWMRDWPFVTGTITSILSMAFGASGPFVATYVKSLQLDRHKHVATMASLLSLQHLLKSLAFGVLGFAFVDWAPFIAAMILCGLAGTWTGKRVLNRMSDRRFKQALDLILLLLAARLIWAGVTTL